MANPGAGSKFVSVNLNKSYGQRSSNLGGTNRIRSGGINGGGGGGGGGGMVVLSRSRSSIVGVQKGGPKLSVPPPLNLPSLRKEHERTDPSSSGGGSAGGGNSGAGARPASSGIGWTKPAALVVQEKDIGNDQPLGVGSQVITGSDQSDRVSRGTSVYMPPSARSGTNVTSAAASSRDFPLVQRAVVLRGEDFPSLQATLPTTSGAAQKQKDNLNTKQNQKASAEPEEQTGNSYLRPPSVTQPHNQASRLIGKASDDKEGVNHRLGSTRNSEQLRKQDDFFPSPLPLVRLNHTSDWADDERDIGNGLPERERDQGYSRSEFNWDRNFDFPRSSVLPRASINDHPEGRALRHEEVRRPPSGGFTGGNAYNRDVRTPSREGRDGSSWRSPSLVKEGFGGVGNGIGARPLGINRENGKQNKYGQSSFGDTSRDGFNSGFSGTQDSKFARRDVGYGQGVRQTGNHVTESYGGRRVEHTKQDYYGRDLPSHRGNSFQNGSFKGLFTSDHIHSVSKEKEKHLTTGKQYFEEPFAKDFGSNPDFDGRDPLTGVLVSVVKRKKDVLKQADYHDPVRDSFEAELERVQKLQEQERQRIIEEQARALELARKEEEERERVAREEEEQRRRLEEEVKEAAWRAEHERLEAMRKAEEQKLAREEEKRRMLLEEERRKEAARKKLVELEAKIARRQAEIAKDNESSSTVKDERMPGVFQEKDVQRVADVVDWEDGERMVERITSSASSDSSSFNRTFEMGSRPQFYRDGDSAFLDKGKPSNSWRRDVFDNGNSSAFIWQDQDNAYRSPKRDAYGTGRSFARKEFNGGSGIMPAKASGRGGISDPRMVEDFSHPRGNRWSLSGDVDPYSRNPDFDPDLNDNFADKFSDMGWGLGRQHASHHHSYSERPYQNSDADGFSSFAKSRLSMRQPRVLPPPSLSAMNKSTFKSQIEAPRSSSGFRDSEMNYHHVTRNSEPILQMGYEASYQDERDRSRMADSQEENSRFKDQKEAETVSPRCDSQSSLSVSSAPSSPTHLSHDDLEDSRESPSLPTAAEGEETHLSENENAAEIGTVGKVGPSSALSPLEDEEWDVENHRDLLEQEEYDEEENGYREEDEVHEEGDENVDLPQEFEDLNLEEKDTANEKDNLVLGVDESVDVVMPSGGNFESKSENGEKTFGIQQVSVGVSEEVVSQDGLTGIGQSVQSGNNSPKISIESSKMTQEAEKTLVNAPHNSDTSVSSAPEIISSSIMTMRPDQPLSSSVDATLPSITQPTMSAVSACPSQSDVPVKLQFGLFSGPSLIPSPVSAIQIGSIQMPLHLNPPVGPSLTQLHPPQPPFFQFGQLRYASPIPQGIVPLGPRSMSFVQSSSPTQYSLNHNQSGPLINQEGQDPGIQSNSVRDEPTALSVDSEPGGQKLLDQSQDSCKVANASSVRQRTENEDMVSHGRADSSLLGDRSKGPELTSQVERGYQSHERKNYRSNGTNKESQSQLHVEHSASQLVSRPLGPTSGNKGKRYVVKNSGSRLSLPVSESVYTDFRGSQRRGRPKLPRTEFRVRENVDKRQRETILLANYPEVEKSSFNGKVYGTSVQGGVSKESKQMGDSENLNLEASAHNIGGEARREKHTDKEESLKKVSSLYVSDSIEGNPERNNSFDEDVDAPLQSGIVRVFKQSGIEAPSDDDDFIEVRSKRQMLNDRREQREKEIKAKSRIVKAPKKRRSVSQNSVASTMSNKATTSLGGETSNNSYSKTVNNDRRSLERPTRFIGSVVSPPLAPIGTPSTNSDTQADIRAYTTKSTQAGSITDISTVGTSLVPSLSFETKNVMVDSVATPLSPWGNARVTQQVMALTQTQLDEAMTPARFEKHATSVGDRTGSIIDQNKQGNSFSSTSSPLNSLFAGERIQFGAVTSPNIFPLRSHIVSNGMGPPGSCRLDVPIEHNLSVLENECCLFFEKDKHLNESCVDLEDCEAEAEAEAAASAVAVAAISSDEIVGSGCSVSVSETKSFEGAANEGLTSETGEVSNQKVGSQSRVEESLSVALPADLSVETPALSLWPSLPSPQHSTGQMLSHFPGVPPSHFYEMNPMLGGPIFAFGPHDETTSTQPQSQKSSAPGSGPLGAWQQCHSGVDSFYGPPAGFTGPFIGPSGGIPGVQGPPHMVVYNHFTPVGQFGQVGLSFMGATYIPSGKQPDWKHNPTSSTSIGEGDMNNLNIPSVQHNPTSMPSSIQHLAPGSPLLPLASPLTMFDMSPFQSSTEVPVQGRWSHFSASPLHSAPLSMPMPQHGEGVLSSNFSQGSTVEQTAGNRFHEPCSSATSDNGRSFSVATSAAVTQFPDELGLLDTSSTTTTRVSVSRPASYKATIMNGKGQSVVTKNLSRNATTNVGDTSSTNNNSNHSNQSTHSSNTSRSSQQQTSTQQYHQSTGYTSQRGGGVSQKVASGSEWSQRKMGFQGRNQSAVTEKKVKQIYVAKPATSRTSTSSSS